MQVDPAQLVGLGKKCDASRGKIGDDASRLQARIQAISGVGLIGDANNALQEVSHDFGTSLNRVLSALEKLSHTIKTASGAFSEGDHAGGKTVRGAGASFIKETLTGS